MELELNRIGIDDEQQLENELTCASVMRTKIEFNSIFFNSCSSISFHESQLDSIPIPFKSGFHPNYFESNSIFQFYNSNQFQVKNWNSTEKSWRIVASLEQSWESFRSVNASRLTNSACFI